MPKNKKIAKKNRDDEKLDLNGEGRDPMEEADEEDDEDGDVIDPKKLKESGLHIVNTDEDAEDEDLKDPFIEVEDEEEEDGWDDDDWSENDKDW